MHTKKTKRTFKPGFTLIELILVMVLTILLFSATIGGMLRSQRSFIFNGADQQVGSILRQARSLAVSGKAQLDYSDYDGDGCGSVAVGHPDPVACATPGQDDYVTPAHYGVYFDTANRKMVLFADLHGSLTEGGYDGSNFTYTLSRDLTIAEYEIPDTLFLLVNDGVTGANTVMYTPVFADTAFSGGDLTLQTPKDLTGEFFVFGLEEDYGSVHRKKCYAIHPISGIAETTAATATSCP